MWQGATSLGFSSNFQIASQTNALGVLREALSVGGLNSQQTDISLFGFASGAGNDNGLLYSGNAYLAFSYPGGSGINRSVSLVATPGTLASLTLALSGGAAGGNATTTNQLGFNGTLNGGYVQFSKPVSMRSVNSLPTQSGSIYAIVSTVAAFSGDGAAVMAPMGSTFSNLYLRYGNYQGGANTFWHIPVVPVAGNANTGSATFSYGSNAFDPFVQTSSVVISNTASETTMLGTLIGSPTFSASTNATYSQFVVGKRYMLQLSGTMSTKAAPSGNTQVRVKLGSTTIGQSNAADLGGSKTATTWTIDTSFTIRTVGSSGQVFSDGLLTYLDSDATSINGVRFTNTGTTFSTTSDLKLDVTWQWTTADTANSITINQASLQQIDPTGRTIPMTINGVNTFIVST